MRIVSLLPSATEIVAAVGGAEDLVGVSHECDYPPGLEGLPVLTRTRTALPFASGEIDRAVQEILRDALAVYEIEIDLLRQASPDVVVTQDLCDVCAVSINDVRHALAELGCENVEVVSCKPTRLADVWDDVRRVGNAIGRGEQGELVAQELSRRVSALGEKAKALGHRPKVLTIEWLDPIMIGGTWMPELVELAGGIPLVTTPGQHSPALTLSDLEALAPDIVLIKPCGFDLARTTRELNLLGSRLPWEKWTGERSVPVFVADGNAYFNRPGPRLVESLEILAACIHPEAFPDLARCHGEAVRRVERGLTLSPFVGS